MKLEDEIKSKFRNNYHKALVNLYYTNNVLSDRLFKMLKEYGLAGSQYNVLRILKGQYPNSATMGLIKERLLDKNSDASRIVQRLYRKGLVDRSEGKTDRRKKDVKINTKGLALLEKMRGFEERLDSVISHLNEDEVALLNEILDKMRNR